MSCEQGSEMKTKEIGSTQGPINNNDQLALRIRTILESFKNNAPEGEVKNPDPGKKLGK